jgi:hypothetical protein
MPVMFGFSLLIRYGLGNTLLLRSNVLLRPLGVFLVKGRPFSKSELTGTQAFPQAFAASDRFDRSARRWMGARTARKQEEGSEIGGSTKRQASSLDGIGEGR